VTRRRSPWSAEIVSVYNFGGRITPEPLAATRGEDGRWIGGSVQQWTDELTTAVQEHHAAGFIYRTTDDTPADVALARWATEVVPPSARRSPGKRQGQPGAQADVV